MLVEGDAYAVARTAERDAGIAFAGLYGLGTGMGEIGIIAAFGRIGTEIFPFYLLRIEIALDYSFHLIARMIAAEAHGHSVFQDIHILTG